MKILAESPSCSETPPVYPAAAATPKSDVFFATGGMPYPKDLPLLNRKVFKGTRVTIREHPYVVSIRRMFAHYLTGALISYNTVLTVAHPVYRVPLEELGVVAAENYADRGKFINPVVFVVIHEKFDPNTLDSDLAVLRTYMDFSLMTNVKSIRVIGSKGKLNGTQAFVTGWGRCDFTGKELCLPRSNRFYPKEVQDPMLRTVAFTITDNPYCSEYTMKQVPLKPGMMCLGTSRMEDPMTSCLAVPGAPLVARGRLAGVLSWGLGCGYIFDMPLVYVNLQYYREWLNHNSEKLSRISQEALNKFVLALESHLMEKWRNMTTPYLMNRMQTIHEYDLQLLDVDTVLMEIEGTVYDIRDFLYDGFFHKRKLYLYANARHSLKNNKLSLEIQHNYTRRPLLPFLSQDRLYDIGDEMQDENTMSNKANNRK